MVDSKETPLTLAELRELEEYFKPFDATEAINALRAVRELIAVRESMDEEQQGMPWKTLHKNDVVKLLGVQ